MMLCIEGKIVLTGVRTLRLLTHVEGNVGYQVDKSSNYISELGAEFNSAPTRS